MRIVSGGLFSALSESLKVLVLAALYAASLSPEAVLLDARAARKAAKHWLRIPRGLHICCEPTLGPLDRVVLRQPLGERQTLSIVVSVDLGLTDVLNELILLVLLSLVVLVQFEATLLRHGGSPLRAEAAGEDAENAEDEE